jgi:hypothetical protein
VEAAGMGDLLQILQLENEFFFCFMMIFHPFE